VANWFEREHGTIHFFDPRLVGAKRRIRLKVSVFEGKLLSIELPPSWLEPVSPPDRDPLYTIHLGEQTIDDNSGHTLNFAQGKLSASLAELISQRHESGLWRAIGYRGIPPAAQLYKEMEVPF
jgi:hypothetical protein